MRRGSLLTVSLLGLCLACWGVREYLHVRTGHVRDLREAALQEVADTARAALAEAEQVSVDQEKRLEEAALESASLRDRITNLEAQRDHLGAESDRQASLVREVRSTLAEAEEQLEVARHETLELAALPRQLESGLNQARERNQLLEEQLDTVMAAAADQPNLHAFAGASSDGTVFAIEGSFEKPLPLPSQVYLCQRDGLVLRGWLSRVEEDTVFGHVETWHRPASTLVKGEKVFIVPFTSHDSHP